MLQTEQLLSLCVGLIPYIGCMQNNVLNYIWFHAAANNI